MTVNATTLAQVKAHMNLTSSTDDAILGTIISAVSRNVEDFIGYELEQKSRTEYYSPQLHDKLVFLRTVPVVFVTSIKSGVVDWDFSTVDALVPDVDYRVKPGLHGVVYFREGVIDYRTDSVEIIYTAGFGVDEAGVEAAAPAITLAAIQQVAEEYRRGRHQPTTQARPGPRGARVFTKEHGMLDSVKRLLQPYERVVVGAQLA